MLDLNRANLSLALVNVAINDAIEQRSDTRHRTTAALSGRQHRRRRMPAQSAIRLVVPPCASGTPARNLRARTSSRSAVAPAANCGRVQVCAARSTRLLRRRWTPARARRRDHHCRPDPFRRVSQLPVSVGAQGDQRQKLASSSSATDSRKLFRSTPHKSRSTRPISTSPIPRSSPH